MDIEHRQACEERLKVREFGVCSLEATMRILSASTDSLKAIFDGFPRPCDLLQKQLWGAY
jgi:hypothetical protein